MKSQTSLREILGNRPLSIKVGRYQRGAIMPLTIIALVALIGIAGLVTDFAPVYWDKNKLQNATDAAALAAEEYLRQSSNWNTEAEIASAKAQAILVFNNQKPEGATNLQAGNIDVQAVNGKPVVTIAGVSSSRDSALTRVLPGAKDSYGVTAESVAKLKTTTSKNLACVSPMVVCGNYAVSQTPYVFNVGSTAGILCKDINNDGVWDQSCNPSSTDLNMAEGNYTMSSSDIESYCYDPTKAVKKGLGNGNVRKGINARFFDDGKIPNGWGTISSEGARDLYAYPFNASGMEIDVNKNTQNYRSRYGALTYADYKTQIDANVNRDVFGASPANATAKFRRVLYVAQFPAGYCGGGDITVPKDQVKVWCMFLRRPVDNDNDIYGEIFQECGSLATSGHTVEVQSTRLAE